MNTSVEEEPQEVAVRRIGTEGSELAVFEFQGKLRELMVSSLQQGYLATGNYVSDAKAVSSQGAMSLGVTLGIVAMLTDTSLGHARVTVLRSVLRRYLDRV